VKVYSVASGADTLIGTTALAGYGQNTDSIDVVVPGGADHITFEMPFNSATLYEVEISHGGGSTDSFAGDDPPPAADGPTGSLGTDVGCYALCDHKHPAQTAAVTPIGDAGGYFTGATVEEALQEVGSGLASVVSGISWKAPVRVATTGAGTLASSFENGDTVDGVVLATGNRILLKDQASGAENGIYTVNASGAPTRATDFDTGAEALGGAVIVTEGTANADKVFICTTNGPITIGSTSLAFAGLSAASALVVQEDDSTVDAAVTTIDFRTALNVTSSPAGEANVSVDLGTGAGQAAEGNHTHSVTNPGNLNVVIGNGVDVITTGVKVYVRMPFNGTFTRWTLMADVSGAIVIDVWRDTYANYPPTDADAMPGAGKEPTITASGTKAEDTSITDWTTDDFSEGDIIGFNVDSCTSIKRVTLELKYTRT
jgi:hypothetical protein